MIIVFWAVVDSSLLLKLALTALTRWDSARGITPPAPFSGSAWFPFCRLRLSSFCRPLSKGWIYLSRRYWRDISDIFPSCISARFCCSFVVRAGLPWWVLIVRGSWWRLCYVAFSFMMMLYCLFVPFSISIFHNWTPWPSFHLWNCCWQVCVGRFHLCLQFSEGGREGWAGAWESCVLHLGWIHWVQRAVLEVWDIQREAQERGGTRTYPWLVLFGVFCWRTLCHHIFSSFLYLKT